MYTYIIQIILGLFTKGGRGVMISSAEGLKRLAVDGFSAAAGRRDSAGDCARHREGKRIARRRSSWRCRWWRDRPYGDGAGHGWRRGKKSRDSSSCSPVDGGVLRWQWQERAERARCRQQLQLRRWLQDDDRLRCCSPMKNRMMTAERTTTTADGRWEEQPAEVSIHPTGRWVPCAYRWWEERSAAGWRRLAMRSPNPLGCGRLCRATRTKWRKWRPCTGAL